MNTDINTDTKDELQYLLIGAGGHAKVLLDTLLLLDIIVSGVCDPLQPASGGLTRLHWYANDNAILQMNPLHTRLVNAVGSTGNTGQRCNIYHKFKTGGFHFHSVIHPTSYVSQLDMEIGEGLQALAGSVINTCVNLGENVLVNSRAVVEHDCTIGAHTHVASGAIICGGCLVGENVHIGAGAVIKQGITIGSGSVIAAGAVVIADVPPFSLMAGVPAEMKRMLPHE
jgi:sugar O-acyltransferase (sialic acid O-acetyltransferase NeuD family)